MSLGMNYGTNYGKNYGTGAFSDSNSIVAKVAFLLFILIVFVLLMKVGIYILGYIFKTNPDPYLFKGMINANHMKIIPADPSLKNAVPIVRSVNQTDGIEFTWSTWIFIKDLEPMNKYKHVFHKGNDNIDYQGTVTGAGLNFPNNAPGLYISPNTNSLVIIMNTFNVINEEITINDIPFNKWISVIIRVEGNNLDVYINGTIVKRHKLSGVPKQNYGDVYVAMNGGFNGYISNLRYWNYAISLYKIQDLINAGPNLSMDDKEMLESEPRYFSIRWFLSGEGVNKTGYGGL